MFLTRSSLPEQELTSVERFRNSTRFANPSAYQGQSPLFSLPLELRELIYKELFGSELVHIFSRQRGDKYIEGIPILYRTNTLSFQSPRDMVFFQARVAPFSTLAQFIDLYCAKTYLHNSLACDKKFSHPWALPRSQFDAYFNMIWLDKGLALNGRHVRLYFESEGTGNTYVASNIKTLLRPDVIPAANVQIFLQDSSNRIIGDDAKLTLTPSKWGSVTVIANTQIAGG
ncbi:hypothetical protein FGRMN_468 [Fusarium graminum]|nr:hypothetical protein FGRMN_468 [Fusarium graminum]